MSGPALAALDAAINGIVKDPVRERRGHRESLIDVRAAVAELIERGAVMLPHGVCLTNPNVPDSLEVPLLATMGELRAFAAALANIRSTS